MPNPRCFLDFTVESEPVGRVIFELFSDLVPKTVENFRSLCTGSNGVNAAGDPLYYKGSPIHRIIAGFMCQGGDFSLRNGKGGESIYGGTFDDEDLRREIDEEGLLVMANRGKNTNGSQFFVSLRPTPHLNGKHVVFGKVVKGYEIIEGLSKLPVNEKDFPLQQVLISNCGELELRKAPVKKARSPTPESDRSRSRSRSNSRSISRSNTPPRSVSPEPKRKSSSSSKRHKSSSGSHHRERDENGKKIGHKKSRKSSSSSSKRSSRKEGEESNSSNRITLPTVEELEAQEESNRLDKMEEERKTLDLEREKLEREEQLMDLKRRYEREGRTEGPVYKGRGSMKAPGGNSSGGMRGW